jgi:molybdopterin converting factor small subunit
MAKIFTQEQLEGKTVVELRELCRKYKLQSLSKARKDVIVDAIIEYYAGLNPASESKSYPTNNSRIPYVNAHVHSFLDGKDKYQSLITVSCGAASGNYPLVGRTVGFVKATYREILNIDDNANGVVNGKEQVDSYILKSGDSIEFIRKAGTKG